MPDTLAQKIRAKYPGAYDDIDDAALERQVLAKHPEYQDLATPEKPAAPTRNVHPMETLVSGAVKMAKDNPVGTGAMIGGLAAAPFTGGLSWPLAMAGTALGGAGGARIGQLASGKVETDPASRAANAKEVGWEAAKQGLGEGAGRLATGAAMLTGRGLYRAGLLPTQPTLAKYPNIVKAGVENAVMVTPGGLAKATKMKNARLADKWQELAAADANNVTLDPQAIADAAKAKLSKTVTRLQDAGEAVNEPAMKAGANRFAARHGQGLPATDVELAKNTLDDRLGGAYTKIRKREPLTAREEGRMQLSHAQSRALETVIPEYRTLNKGIMDASGLAKAIERRTAGSGGNQGLENALTMGALGAGNLAAVPARLAMLPPALSGLGIAAYHTAKEAGPGATAALKALLAQLGGGDE